MARDGGRLEFSSIETGPPSTRNLRTARVNKELRSWHELIESHKSAVRTNDSVRRTRAATDGGRLKSSVRKCLNEHKPRRTVLVRASEYVCTFTIASSWPFIHAGKVGECRDRFSNPGSRSQ
ncbi:uncharacterized protein LOC113465177 isoform X2 [Ceratina calcarata]|uniref:Uncharacterized protein LOC113465177 isoform X2 n=1 Tax=Ceratina calcarata TaxID=156304 RepID=A0AAJ7SBK6_9HYME|nr:uncharacterized protein LOC113465177 isoform X2 [Ceratina calcarata]